MPAGDPDPYLLLNHGARVGTTLWNGPVILAPDAIYLFKESTGVPHAHGALGAFYLLIDALAQRVLPPTDLTGGPYTDIPAPVRNDPAWPISNPPDHPVLILPRAAIQAIHHRRGQHEVELAFDGTHIAIKWGQLGGNRVNEFLVANGWPVVWNGLPSNINPAAVTALPRPPRPLVATLALTLAILLVILSIACSMLPHDYQRYTDVAIPTLWALALLTGLFGAAALIRGV